MKCMITRLFDFRQVKVNVSDLCRECGISRTHFYSIINDKKEPSVEIAIRITNYLNNALSDIGYGDHMYDVDDLWRIDQ